MSSDPTAVPTRNLDAPRVTGMAQALTNRTNKRITLTELWRILDEVDPGTRIAADRRNILDEALRGLADRDVITLPAAPSWDRTEKPALPRFVTMRTTATAPGPQRTPVWHPALAWVAEERVPAQHRADLEKINRWLHTSRDQTTVPLRERSLEIFGNEKTLDRLLRSTLFAPQRLTLNLLRTRRAAPRFTHEIVSDATTLLIVENSDTFDSFAHTLAQAPHGIGIVGWGSGGSFEASVLSVPRLTQPVDRILYFGDLDLRGLQIPASASATAQTERIPPVEPATALYEALLMVGKRQSGKGKAVSAATAHETVTWLPAHLRGPVIDLLTGGHRLAQEHVGLAYLSAHWDELGTRL